MKQHKRIRIALITLTALLAFACALTLTGCGGEDGDEQDTSYITDNIWIAGDGSELVFEDGGSTFCWYRTEGDHDGDRFKGPATVYRGKAAADYVTEDLAEYGVTKEELTDLFQRDNDLTMENFIAMTFDHQEVVMDGETVVFDDPVTSYYGFVDEENGYFSIVNMRNAGTYDFTKK